MALAKQNVKSAPAAPALISLAPDAFTLGLFDDQDGTITDAATCVFDWNGSAPSDTPALALEITDVNGGTHQQYWSLGSGADWEPSENGEGFVAKSGKTSINRSTNLGMLLESMVAEGFPAELLATGNLKCLIGTTAHWLMKKTERTGLIRAAGKENKPSGTLIVSKIHSLPGADTKASPKATAGKTAVVTAAVGGKANGKAVTATKDSATDEIDSVLTSAIIDALGETDPLPKKSLIQIASAAFKGTPNHSKAIARVNSAVFIASLADSGVSTDGAQFSLAG